MNRTQRAIKKKYRERENNASYFKNIALQSKSVFSVQTSKTSCDTYKSVQQNIKSSRNQTRNFCRTIKNKEAIEV